MAVFKLVLALTSFLVVWIQVRCSDECFSDSGCAFGEYCCIRAYPSGSICKPSCVGETCFYDGACAPGESCKSGECQSGGTDECSDDSECSSKHTLKKYCCERRYPDWNICASNCLGESCIQDINCAPDECCSPNDKCKSSGCLSGLAGWVVAVIVISILVVVVLPIAIVVFCCVCAAGTATFPRRRLIQDGVVFAEQPTTVVAAQHTQQQQPSDHAYPPMNIAPPPYSAYPSPPNFQQGPPQGLPLQPQPGQPPYPSCQAAGLSPFPPGPPSKQ